MNHRLKLWLLAAAGLVVLVGVYANHFDNSFHLRDEPAIVQNEQIRELRNFVDFFSNPSPSGSGGQDYHPVLTLSLAVDYALAGGFSVFPYHLQSFVWFCLLLILMFLLYRGLLIRTFDDGKADFWALLCVFLYALHPATAETVNPILRRGDIIATCGVVGGILAYVTFPAARRWGLYLIPVLLGLFSGLSALMFAPLLLLYLLLIERDDTSPGLGRRGNRNQALSMAWAILPGVIAGLGFIGLYYLMTPAASSPFGPSTFQYAMTQPSVIFHYVRTLFLPIGLSADAGWPVLESMAAASAFLGLAFLGLLLWVLWRLSMKKEFRGIAFGLGWFLLALIPTSSLLPFPQVMNYQRTFFPFVGLVFSSVIGLRELLHRKVVPHHKTKLGFALALLLLVLPSFAIGSFARNQVWQDEESLWGDVISKKPSHGLGHMNYGLALMSKGKAAKALEHYQRAAEFLPRSYLVQINLGLAKSELDRPREADTNFRRAFDYKPPRDPLPAFYYSRFLYQHGQYKVAFSVIQDALERDDFYLPLRILALQMLTEIGSWQEVREIAEATLAQAPSSEEARTFLDLALADGAGHQEAFPEILERARRACAVEDFLYCTLFSQQALMINPESPEILGNLCFASWRMGNLAEAEQACEQAIQRDPDFEFIRQDPRAIQEAIRNSKK